MGGICSPRFWGAAIFKLTLTTCSGSGTQRICRSLTWNCCFCMDSSQSCWQKKSEPKMQLGFSRLALMTTSCSYEPHAIPIWTAAVPKVGAAPPPSSSCFTFSGWAACRVSYSGRPILVQVASVCKSAKVNTWLMVMGINQPRLCLFATGRGVISRSLCLSIVLISLPGV